MLRIHQLIQDQSYPNCGRVAREFEVSVRTIKRDVDFMKCRLNLPIEYDPKRYGFFYTSPVEQFPGVTISEAEMFALLIAQKAVERYEGTPFQKPLQSAFAKLAGQLDARARLTLNGLDRALSFRPLGPGEADEAAFATLAQAVHQHQVVEFRYRKLGQRRPALRRVHPHHLACVDSVWYLFAHDVDRGALRTFVLTRMAGVRTTGEPFVPRADFRADDYLRGSFSVFRGGDDYEVAIDFDAWAADLLRGRKWHASQQFQEMPRGGCRLVLRLNNLEEIERWVLSWGHHATVIRPRELARRIRQTARSLTARYDTDRRTAG
jgi:proteasome accessory factor B